MLTLTTPDHLWQIQIDADHPMKPLIEIGIESRDALLAARLFSDPETLEEIAHFFLDAAHRSREVFALKNSSHL